MTVLFKAKRKGVNQASDRARMRAKVKGLLYYLWRGDLKSLGTASQGVSLNKYHRDLFTYMHRNGAVEEVAAKLVRNILNDSPEGIVAELEALREEANGGDGLVEHYIISLRPGEALLENFDDAVDTFVNGLGLGRCPILAAAHLDTKNPHFHIMALKIDHETGKPVPLPQYDKIRGHQLLAVLEDKFGWAREKRARYEVIHGRLIRDGEIDVGPANQPDLWPDEFVPRKGLSSKAMAFEAAAAVESAERIIKRVVPALLERSPDLPSLLSALEKEGISLARKGSGAQYRVTFVEANGSTREEFLKADTLRKWTYKSLHKAFGDLPKEHSPSRVPRSETALNGNDRSVEYAKAKKQHREQLNSLCSNVRLATINLADQKAAIAEAKIACAFPSFEEWKNGAVPADASATFAQSLGVKIFSPRGMPGSKAAPSPMPDADFIAFKRGRAVIYQPKANLFGNSKIVDFGDHIILVGETSDMAIEKALILFKLRGATGVSAAGFSRNEFARAQKIAAKIGLAFAKEGESQKAANGVPANTTSSTKTARDSNEREARPEVQPVQQTERTVPEKTAPIVNASKPTHIVRPEVQPARQPKRASSATAGSIYSPSNALPRDVAVNPQATLLPAEQKPEPIAVPEKLQVWREAMEFHYKLKSREADKKELRIAEVARDRHAVALQSAIDAGEISKFLLKGGERDYLEVQVSNFRRNSAWLQAQGRSMGLER